MGATEQGGDRGDGMAIAVLVAALLALGTYILYTAANPNEILVYAPEGSRVTAGPLRAFLLRDPSALAEVRRYESSCRLLLNRSADARALIEGGYRLLSVSSVLRAKVRLSTVGRAGGEEAVEVVVVSPELEGCVAVLSNGRRSVAVAVRP